MGENVEVVFTGLVKVSQEEFDEFGVAQAVQNHIGYSGVVVIDVEEVRRGGEYEKIS